MQDVKTWPATAGAQWPHTELGTAESSTAQLQLHYRTGLRVLELITAQQYTQRLIVTPLVNDCSSVQQWSNYCALSILFCNRKELEQEPHEKSTENNDRRHNIVACEGSDFFLLWQ
jgi:hypothetical protein